ncbi:hypothetical protein ATANTOWER_027824 [Ataeniobius toweri]|uniref:Uncharacterized protein n=1 Tax=Ataeniobius toweri TaxID=208326 RepID=A0ABU7CIR2_9TELE|nr:hypothetical protein [Ataeniobius toweri]
MVPRPASGGLFLCAPRSKSPTGEPTTRCFAIICTIGSTSAGYLQASTYVPSSTKPVHPPPLLWNSPRNPPSTEPTKGLSITAGLTSLVPCCSLQPDSLSSWRFTNSNLDPSADRR